MPERSGFFDSTTEDVRLYPARDFADYFAQILTSGVFNGGQYLNPTATGTDTTISLSPGYAWIKGYVYSIYTTPLSLQVKPASNLPRIDRIVLRLDTSLTERSIRAIVLQGSPDASPTPPEITRSGNVYELSIAQVRVSANTTIIEQSDITDERLDNSLCGLVNSLVQVDTSVMQQEWNAFMETIKNAGYATIKYADELALKGVYGVASNVANAYSVNIEPRPVAITEGLRVTIKINASNTGASTLNVNGLGPKSILKSNGSALNSGFLRVNSVYTFVYNGTSFILQGEGGEYGTAIAGDVRTGKTIGTENGIINGTLVPYGQSVANSFTATIPAGSSYSRPATAGMQYIAAKTTFFGLSQRSVHSAFNVLNDTTITAISRTSLSMFNAGGTTNNFAVDLIEQTL